MASLGLDSVEKESPVTVHEEEPVDKVMEESLIAHEEVEKSPLTAAADQEDENINDEMKITSSKPRKLPSWLLTAAGGGTGGGVVKKEAKKVTASKRPKSPEAVPSSKVRHNVIVYRRNVTLL